VYRRPTRELAFGNAGHPPALLFNGPSPEGAHVHRLKSQGPVIGMLPEYEAETTTVKLDDYARLLVYSDGVFEVENTDGVMWKFDDFVDFVCRLPGEGASAIDQLLAHVRGLHTSEVLADDFSMLEFRF
jgi:sigma-B regulation protein RsbU (phosphoserine phosphatase)